MAASLKLPLTSDTQPGLVFHSAELSDLDEICEFLLIHFFPEVPIAKVVNMDVDKEVRPWVRKFVGAIVSDSNSIIVRDAQHNNRLAAVRLNIVEQKGVDNEKFHLTHYCNCVDHPLMWMNGAFLDQLAQGVDCYEMFWVDKIFYLVLVSVSNEYGRRGLAAKLVELSIDMAKQKGLHVSTASAVNEFAAKALGAAGFKSIKQLAYSDFEFNGSRPLVNSGVHQIGRLMALNF